MFNVEVVLKDELPKDQIDSLSENGSGSEYASYIVVKYGDKILHCKSDAMEPEDASFCRDLDWIVGMVQQAYNLGKIDGADGK